MFINEISRHVLIINCDREHNIQSFSSLHNSDTLIDFKVRGTAGLLLFHYSL